MNQQQQNTRELVAWSLPVTGGAAEVPGAFHLKNEDSSLEK